MNRQTPQRMSAGIESVCRCRILPARINIFVFCCMIIFVAILPACNKPSRTESEDAVSVLAAQSALEAALYEKQEFFGAEALVPLPTAEARENVARIAASDPDNPMLLEKLAELDEKLGDFDASEKKLIRLAEIDKTRLENLAAFYDRRALFEKAAETQLRIFSTAAPENRPAAFERLINFAKRHDLKKYLRSDFYAKAVKENPEAFAIFEKLIDDYLEEKNYPEALKFARQAKEQFPERRSILLEKEIDILLETGNRKEAEAVYQRAFDPLWSDSEAEKFYDFLSDLDRLRAYGAELKSRFERNPADFDAGVRLALYRNHDYAHGNDAIAPVILKLERAKKSWTTEELFTVTRLLLRQNEAEMASRFLYTLYAREDFKADRELRAKLLYQLFEMFSDAENQRLPITKGDLRFYEDVAKTDTSPGITTGILSLIFSDTNPKKRLDEQEKKAIKFFNRAAAYRIFLAYKEEFPISPELAQMYLDIVRLYTATKETEIAEATLNEFASRYENSAVFSVAALKLADAFLATNNTGKAREVYQKALDYIGKGGASLAPRRQNPSRISGKDSSSKDDSGVGEKPIRNRGINIPDEEEKPKGDYYNYQQSKHVLHDYLGADAEPPVSYSEVLEKLVALLAKEKNTPEILALFSNEIQKHPDEEWLYEQRLSWLEQTNLTGDQLQVYQSALARFQSRGWQDKLARWFLRQKRQKEFAQFSQELIAKLNDNEAAAYLSQFADEKVAASDFEKQFFLKLYQTANERFPHNLVFVEALLRFYKSNKRDHEWRRLAARYYFESKMVREQFLDDLAKSGELRAFLAKADGRNSIIYELFRADASVRLSNYENAVQTYRKLNRLYPNTPEFSECLLTLARSFGQKDHKLLIEAVNAALSQANFLSSSAEYRTRAGEIYAELGLYQEARREWEKLISLAAGEKEIYLDVATLYWDYFQYEDALRTIRRLREKFADESLYAFETGAILEAQHRRPDAVVEYVRALGLDGDDFEQRARAQKRLLRLCKIDQNICRKIDSVFQAESRRKSDASFLALGYSVFLTKIEQSTKAQRVLETFIRQSKNKEFLEEARNFYQTEEDRSGERIVLRRLSEIEESPRRKIGYRLELAQSLEISQEREALRQVLRELIREFPTNYGVLTEAADFFRRSGFEDESVQVLQDALSRSRGSFRSVLAQKLTGRLIQLNRLDSAERILLQMHDEDKAEINTFRELAKVCVLTGKPELLRKTFAETLAALQQSDEERRPLNRQIAELRHQMIGAFTRLKDYKSAVEQHIEIINREPENEELTEDAILYVRRYGGAELLLDYYSKASAQSFKNYRWKVVLARIYAARDDWKNVAENYKAAIVNQPEMAELYVELADAETRRNNFDEALNSIDRAMELTGEMPEYIKKKIEILRKAGRSVEADREQQKLPGKETEPTTNGEFAAAQKLATTEKEKARRLYREAFEKLLRNSVGGELKTADITGYVHSLRDEAPLDQINKRLWQLRGKLVEKAEAPDSTEAGEARKRISILDGAMTESIGGIAKTIATDEELASLHIDFQQLIEKTAFDADRHQALSLVQNISRKAGFGDLEEKILRKKLQSPNLSAQDRQIHLQNLLNFYSDRGGYHKAFDLLREFESDNHALKAETARLVNNREKELEALRVIYWAGDRVNAGLDPNVARYLEILYTDNREELKSLTSKPSSHQLQLINFLLGKGLTDLAHSAIESANLPPAWKVSRHAETSLALKEFTETADCYFCTALEIDSIGNLISRKPDKKQHLVGDDWFRLSREYGEWLFETEKRDTPPTDFLVSMIENQPRNGVEQFKMGEFYLERALLDSAIQHFRLALEINPEDKTSCANLGAAYYLSGREDLAEESWKQMLEDEQISTALEFFQVLQKRGLSSQARERLRGIINKFLRDNDADTSQEFQDLVRALAHSFDNEAEKSVYFRKLLDERPSDTSLAEMLLSESLIARTEQGEFYELLIDRLEGFTGYDYDYNFAAINQRVWSKADAESVYDQENEFRTEEPDNERYRWQIRYLEYLFEQNEDRKAALLIARIEKDLGGRFPRPSALRLAGIRLQVRAGDFDTAQIERFIGITASDSAGEVGLPSIERLNDTLQILKKENREEEMNQISESFYGRMLALEQLEAANFAGLSRAHFRRGETEKALRILQLMVEVGDEAKRETAFAEIAAIEPVKLRSTDARKLPEALKTNSINKASALKLAAEISAEFRQPQMAVNFRNLLVEVDPTDLSNQIELAGLLIARGEQENAASLLRRIIDSRDAPRPLRWQAKMILRETGRQTTEIACTEFDFLSQYSCGLIAKAEGRNEAAKQFFQNSLIADINAEIPHRQELIKLYASSNYPFAALKLSEKVESANSDEMLGILSGAAENVGDFVRALDFEKAKSLVDQTRIAHLQQLIDEKFRRVTEFTVDLENTRKL